VEGAERECKQSKERWHMNSGTKATRIEQENWKMK